MNHEIELQKSQVESQRRLKDRLARMKHDKTHPVYSVLPTSVKDVHTDPLIIDNSVVLDAKVDEIGDILVELYCILPTLCPSTTQIRFLSGIAEKIQSV